MNRKMLFLLIAYVSLVFFMSTRPGLRPPGPGFHMTDKVAHFAEYAVMGALIAGALGRVTGASQAGTFMFLLAIAATIGAVDETLQGYTPDREMSIYDWMADALGAAAAIAFVMSRRAKRAIRTAHGGDAR